jgi:hypothetical protein
MIKEVFCGFCGQINYRNAQEPQIVVWQKRGYPVSLHGENGAIQWLSPYARETTYPQGETALGLGSLFLIGPVPEPEDSSLEEEIGTVFNSADYKRLTSIGQSAGCFIRKDRSLFLWTGRNSNATVFFRMEGSLQFRWSTNPLDLLYKESDFDLAAIRENCRGNVIKKSFVYKNVQAVPQGHLLKVWLDEGAGTLCQETYCFDQGPLMNLSLSSQTPLRRFVEATQQALEASLRPLVGIGPVGLMLSGGAGSTTLAIVMKKLGIQVIAYHLDSPIGPEGSERQFAQKVCETLSIPLRTILTEPDFSPSVRDVFVHPYAHPYGPKMPLLARAVENDRVHWLVDGGGDDAAYGLIDKMEYSVYSIATAAIPWREKVSILQALFSTRWSIWQLARSAWPRTSLMGGGERSGHMADFLTAADVLPDTERNLSPSLPELVTESMMSDHGIQTFYPYLSRRVQEVALALPDVFRFLPVSSLAKFYPNLPVTSYIPKLGALVDKPVLRLAASATDPTTDPSLQRVLWRNWHPYTDASIQQACVDNPDKIYHIIADSYLVHAGVIDLARLKEGLAKPEWIRSQYIPLIATCLMDDFMRQEVVQKQLERRGPEWE